MDSEAFALRLRRLRDERDWRQQDLGRYMALEARRMGRPLAPVPKATISCWENGVRLPDPFYALLLCRTLGVGPEALALEELLTPGRTEELVDAVGRRGGARSAGQGRRPGSSRWRAVLAAARGR